MQQPYEAANKYYFIPGTGQESQADTRTKFPLYLVYFTNMKSRRGEEYEHESGIWLPFLIQKAQPGPASLFYVGCFLLYQ